MFINYQLFHSWQELQFLTSFIHYPLAKVIFKFYPFHLLFKISEYNNITQLTYINSAFIYRY